MKHINVANPLIERKRISRRVRPQGFAMARHAKSVLPEVADQLCTDLLNVEHDFSLFANLSQNPRPQVKVLYVGRIVRIIEQGLAYRDTHAQWSFVLTEVVDDTLRDQSD